MGMPVSDPEQLLRLAATSDELVEAKVLSTMPDWERYERGAVLPQGSARLLSQLHGLDAGATKILLTTYPEIIRVIPTVLSNVAADIQPAQYLLTCLSETCRTDASIWDVIVAPFATSFGAFTVLLGRPNIDTYTADKAVQVLTSIMSHSPKAFPIEQVKLVCTNLVSGQFKTSPVGVLEGFSNLLKQDSFRQPLFEIFGTLERILAVSVETPAALYRSMFCLWVGSFNSSVLSVTFTNKADAIVSLLKSTFQECRVEKILRMALQVVKNLLGSSQIAEAMVESGILHVIQPLEYEKWRDADLYEEIRTVASRVASETSKHSNFERYTKELSSGTLKWGFIHSEKFWLENVSNFERDSFATVAQLVALLGATDPTTQAVACHDLGEFARLHPTGKRVVNKLNGKTAVMNLMTSPNREVAKEALLCTQKIMLNQWQKK